MHFLWNVLKLASKRYNHIVHRQNGDLKPPLMLLRQTLNRLIILGFMVLVGYCLAKAINSGSILGVFFAVVSFGAAIYFLYLAAKAKEEIELETEEAS